MYMYTILFYMYTIVHKFGGSKFFLCFWKSLTLTKAVLFNKKYSNIVNNIS